ncbi:MAG: DUF6585 family protein [Chloroflexota bacterium]
MPPSALSPSDDLGPLLSEHRPRPSSRWPFALLSAAAFPGAIVSGAIGLSRWYFAYGHLGPAVAWRWSGAAFALTVVLAGAGLVGLVLWLRPSVPLVQVRQDGLRLVRGRRSRSFRWSQVRQVHTSAIRYRLPGLGRRTEAELHLGFRPPGEAAAVPSGTTSSHLIWVHLPHTLSDFDGLTAAVKSQVYPLLLSEMARAFSQGQSLSFGRLHLTMEGVRMGRRLLRWTDLARVRLENGVVRLRPTPSSRSRELRLHAHRLPNLEVCLHLIDYLSRQR